jgi:hypothetical protein
VVDDNEIFIGIIRRREILEYGARLILDDSFGMPQQKTS